MTSTIEIPSPEHNTPDAIFPNSICRNIFPENVLWNYQKHDQTCTSISADPLLVLVIQSKGQILGNLDA